MAIGPHVCRLPIWSEFGVSVLLGQATSNKVCSCQATFAQPQKSLGCMSASAHQACFRHHRASPSIVYTRCHSRSPDWPRHEGEAFNTITIPQITFIFFLNSHSINLGMDVSFYSQHKHLLPGGPGASALPSLVPLIARTTVLCAKSFDVFDMEAPPPFEHWDLKYVSCEKEAAIGSLASSSRVHSSAFQHMDLSGCNSVNLTRADLFPKHWRLRTSHVGQGTPLTGPDSCRQAISMDFGRFLHLRR